MSPALPALPLFIGVSMQTHEQPSMQAAYTDPVFSVFVALNGEK